jgi:drug/metabolite transporter (DMT)-like permease
VLAIPAAFIQDIISHEIISAKQPSASLPASSFGYDLNLHMVTLPVLGAIMFIGLISTAVSLLTWNKALAVTDAATCSLFYPLQALVSAVLGVALLHEKLTASFFIGAVLIVGGILYNVLADAKRPSHAPVPADDQP